MKRVLYCCIVCLCFSNLLFAQNNFKPGFIVLGQSDTVRGYIDYGNWSHNPRLIRFKSKADNEKVYVYTPADISYFEITDQDIYKKAVLIVDMRPVKSTDITALTNDSSRLDTVFLRVLVMGKKISFFELLDIKYHFFIEKENNSIEELEYKLRMDPLTKNILVDNNFRNQLGILVPDNSPDLHRKISHAKYISEDLAPIVIALNEGDSVKRSSTLSNSIKVLVFGGLGLDFSLLRFTGGSNATVGMHFGVIPTPSFHFGFDLLSPRDLNAWVLRLELGGSYYVYNGVKHDETFVGHHEQTETYKVRQSNVQTAVSVIHYFGRSEKPRFYLGAGIDYHFSGYSDNVYTLVNPTQPQFNTTQGSYLQFKGIWPSFFLTTGVKLNRKFEVGGTFDFTGIVSNYDMFSGKPRTLALRVNYVFGKQKEAGK